MAAFFERIHNKILTQDDLAKAWVRFERAWAKTPEAKFGTWSKSKPWAGTVSVNGFKNARTGQCSIFSRGAKRWWKSQAKLEAYLVKRGFQGTLNLSIIGGAR